jgi:hypothetical protein
MPLVGLLEKIFYFVINSQVHLIKHLQFKYLCSSFVNIPLSITTKCPEASTSWGKFREGVRKFSEDL